jgi:Methyltransferase domain
MTRPDDPYEKLRCPVDRCPLCGGTASLAFVATDRNRELSSESFRYRRCGACGVISLANVPADMGRFYPQEYYELPDADELARVANLERHKVDFIGAAVEPGRLVEIGPGAGVFSFAAREAGFEVTAIEMDARACVHLVETVGVVAINSADPAGAVRALPASRAVAMWHVIEHLPDPWRVLEATAANLEPGGVLALAAPNPDSAQFRILGGRWAHVDAPRHLYLLPLSTLTAKAASLGLRRALATTHDPSGRHWNRFGWEYAIRRRPASGPSSRLVRAASLALTGALRPVEHRGLRGAAYTCVFVKGSGGEGAAAAPQA